MNHFVFERTFYFNEILSFIGFYIFITNSFTSRFTFKIQKNIIYKAVLLLLTLCFIHIIVGVFIKTNWYYFLRNLSIIYSIFSFFIGFYLYETQFLFFKKAKWFLYGYSILFFYFPVVDFIDRNAYSYWFSSLQKNLGLTSLLVVILLNLCYLFAYTSFTVVLIICVLLLVTLVKNYTFFKRICIIVFSAFLFVFILLITYLKEYSLNTIKFFGNLEYVYSLNPIFSVDHNTSWRLILWYRGIVENFPNYILGVGIGTPLLPYRPNITSSDLGQTDEYISHVFGLHNTYLTLFVRFGIPFIVFLLIVYRSVFKEFFHHRKYYLKNKNDISLFLGFITISTVGLFNLLLETPTLASIYWVSLGFVSKAIFYRQKKLSNEL